MMVADSDVLMTSWRAECRRRIGSPWNSTVDSFGLR
jgi:hypothetical protein